jgi:hypothetical protein
MLEERYLHDKGYSRSESISIVIVKDILCFPPQQKLKDAFIRVLICNILPETFKEVRIGALRRTMRHPKVNMFVRLFGVRM